MKYTYETFPESTATTKGMQIIQGDLENVIGKIEKIEPVYAIKDGQELHLKFIFPTELKTKKYPVLIHVQGSAWKTQNLDNHVLDFATVVASGVAVVIVEYRPSTLAPFPAQVEDLKSAVRYLQKHAVAYPIDMDNIILSGDSSGGHTILCALATWEDHRLDSEDSPLPSLKGVIDFYGPTHLSKMAEDTSAVEHRGAHSPEGLLIGGYDVVDEKEIAYKCSPIGYFKEQQKLPPLLIMHGSKDRQVPFSQSVILCDHLQSLGIDDVTFYQVKGADHGGSVFWCPATLGTVVDFIHQQTK